MTKQSLEELFGEFGRIADTLFGDPAQPKSQVSEPTTPKQTAAASSDDSKLITALEKCYPQYKPALTRLVAQTATHVKQSANPKLSGAHAIAALYTNQNAVAMETLDAIALPTNQEIELRAMMHYAGGNFPLSTTLFEKMAENYTTKNARFAHVSALNRQEKTSPQQYARILNGLWLRSAPASDMMGVMHFNRGEMDGARGYFTQSLELTPTAQRKLNLMTAIAARSDIDKARVMDSEMPSLFQEFQYAGSIEQAKQELNRTRIGFPYLKVTNLFEVACSIYQAP